MIFTSYYTKNTPYENVANECLLPTLTQWNLNHDIEAVDDRGSWAENTAYKAEHIKKMLLKHRRPICFLDADAKIMKYPILLENIAADIDFAHHNFDWFLHWQNISGRDKFELLSGTMVFAYNAKVLSLVDEWIAKVKKNVLMWEQTVLENLLAQKTNLKICYLPAEYCCVLLHDNTIPPYITDPVIIHTQASRKHKRWWQKEAERKRHAEQNN